MGMILGFLASGFNGLIVVGVASLFSFLGGGYLGYNYEKNYYEAKIAKDEIGYQAEIDKAREKGARAVAQFVEQLRQEQARSAAYQNQVRAIYAGIQPGNSSSNCYVSYGFIRLFNASASGQGTEPAGTDQLIAPVDLAAVLAASIENHGKYREAAKQIDANRAAHD